MKKEGYLYSSDPIPLKEIFYEIGRSYGSLSADLELAKKDVENTFTEEERKGMRYFKITVEEVK